MLRAGATNEHLHPPRADLGELTRRRLFHEFFKERQEDIEYRGQGPHGAKDPPKVLDIISVQYAES